MRRTPPDQGIWFVYRTPYEGPTGKRVTRLPDPSVLAWFQRLWTATADVVAVGDEHRAHRWATAQVAGDLGGEVYGLSSVFQSAHEHGLPPPSTWRELRAVLDRHLYVEGTVRADEHSVRASTDDDDIPLAYYFLDDALAAAHPDRLAFLLHEPWELPDGAADGGGFDPGMALQRLDGAGGGAGATYVVVDAPGDVDWDGTPAPLMIPGVRLPRLAAWLHAADLDGATLSEAWRAGWPTELLLLRALVAPGEQRLSPALERRNRLPVDLDSLPDQPDWLTGPQPAAHAAARRLLDRGGAPTHRDPAATRIREAEHMAQIALHANLFFGHDRWWLFDDAWAAAHPDLARSLLRYAAGWDPLPWPEGPSW